MKIAGMIYAGGRGERMGGVDKAFLELDGAPFVAHVSRFLNAKVDQVFITRQADQEDVSEYGKVIIDGQVDEGPLAGLIAAIDHVKAAGFDLLVTIPVDCPAPPSDLIEKLIHERKPHSMVETEDGWVPTMKILHLHADLYLKSAYNNGARALRSGRK